MRKRDDAKNRRETLHALAMILQIGLAIGYYIDRLFGTKCWVLIMMAVGILAAIRSMLILTGHYRPGSTAEKAEGLEKGQEDEHSKDNPD